MADQKGRKVRNVVNVEMKPNVNEMLKLLKKKYDVRNMSDVVEMLIREKHPDIAEIGDRRAEEMEQLGIEE